MAEKATLLKVLLKERHLQTHRAFCREYDKVAAEIDDGLVGSYPGKTQFYRWLSGDLVGLPYVDHCRILESMLPGWTAQQLFEPHESGIEFGPEPPQLPAPRQALSLAPVTNPVTHPVGAIGDADAGRSGFTHNVPSRELLGMLCQQYADSDVLEQMRGVLIESDNLFGPAQVIPTVTEQIKIIQNLRQHYRGADQQALLHIQAKYAELAGWFHQDYGDYAGAEYWTNRALEWSHGTPDHDLTVFILARKANLAGEIGDPLQTIDMGMAAENMARPRSRLAAVAATFAAHGHALRGDRDATLRAYDHAKELLSTMDDDPNSPWGVWLDDVYIDIARDRSLAQLGEYTQAAEGYESAIAALPSEYRRDRGVYLARAARAHAGAGDPEQAAALGLQALAIGVETHSGRTLTELTQLNDTLTLWNTTAVTDFHNAITQTIRL